MSQSMISDRKVQLALGCSLAALCWPATAEAQVQPQAQVQPRSPAPDDSATVGEIIITAQRRAEPLQDVPIAVAAVTDEQLIRQGISGTLDLGRAVRSLTITNFGGYALPRIRGVGNNVFGPGYEGGVATYVDGVYIGSAPASLFSLNNIERIEVLKGPQGTLFGRNATGGLIQVISREPSATPGGTIEIGLDNYQTLGTDFYVTG